VVTVLILVLFQDVRMKLNLWLLLHVDREVRDVQVDTNAVLHHLVVPVFVVIVVSTGYLIK
jgi:hypothetical protein